MHEMTASQARSSFSDVSDAAALHRPTRITRRRADPVVVLSERDLGVALSRFGFSPEVFRENGNVSIWLPELGVWGRGANLSEAKDDLLDEIDQILELFERDERFRTAPNIEPQLGWIMRLGMLDTDRDRLEAVFAPPPNC
jgi:hypothetical protein